VTIGIETFTSDPGLGQVFSAAAGLKNDQFDQSAYKAVLFRLAKDFRR
jgi:hypothetical protein